MLAARMRTCLLAAGLLLTGSMTTSAQEPAAGQTLRQLLSAPAPADHPSGDARAAEKHGAAHGEGEHNHGEGEHHEEPSDLLLGGLFTTGWTERFEEREREGRAPRFNLFKSRQGFLERIVFADYAFTGGLDSRRFDEHEVVTGLDWAFNRRFQLGVESVYTWQRPTSADGRRGDGLRWDASTRLQLIDTADRAYNFQVHVLTPETNLDAPQTELAFTLAGFEDLTKTLGLYRVGLYYDVEYVTLMGPRDAGDQRRPASLMRYDISVAKTLVDPKTPLIADFTVFFEAFGETTLGGTRAGRTDVTFTPGLRFNPTGREEKAWWVQVGVEFPVTGPRPFNERIFVALIHDF